MLHNRRAGLKFQGFWLIEAFPGLPPAAKQDVATEFAGAEVKVPRSAGGLSTNRNDTVLKSV
jgi:hypothetical protein